MRSMEGKEEDEEDASRREIAGEVWEEKMTERGKGKGKGGGQQTAHVEVHDQSLNGLSGARSSWSSGLKTTLFLQVHKIHKVARER
ncbi:hypothetical protein Nepgr_014160 [Nepenthes gracilis]|uniref:Uncharacterized protein n=1 Tax=Nepenthes gracilis TaxID=150966 RepID=A0AAD3SKD3_NEPGR|nr:hypothetical protein Nepgr_014160 [Nepenthes gracilis]